MNIIRFPHPDLEDEGMADTGGDFEHTVAVEAISTHMEFHMKANPNGISNKRRWAGRILSGFATLFFLVDGGMKLFKPPVVVQATVGQFGYPESTIVGIGIALLVPTVLYVIPRTSILGAILLTGYLGGAVASNVRIVMPLFNILFPVVLAALAWGGLWLRDQRLEQLLPLASEH